MIPVHVSERDMLLEKVNVSGKQKFPGSHVRMHVIFFNFLPVSGTVEDERSDDDE